MKKSVQFGTLVAALALSTYAVAQVEVEAVRPRVRVEELSKRGALSEIAKPTASSNQIQFGAKAPSKLDAAVKADTRSTNLNIATPANDMKPTQTVTCTTAALATKFAEGTSFVNATEAQSLMDEHFINPVGACGGEVVTMDGPAKDVLFETAKCDRDSGIKTAPADRQEGIIAGCLVRAKELVLKAKNLTADAQLAAARALGVSGHCKYLIPGAPLASTQAATNL